MEDLEQKLDENLGFEDRIERAKEILSKLSSHNLNLKDGIELYKNGIKELEIAQNMLDSAKLEYEEIKLESKSQKDEVQEEF